MFLNKNYSVLCDFGHKNYIKQNNIVNEEQKRQKHIWDYEAAKDYYFQKGKAKGRQEAIMEGKRKTRELSVRQIEELKRTIS